MRKELKAFTLIELLVVIAIIGILAAVLMPALGRARQLAQEKTCLSNLHNIGMALQIYNQANDNYFPSCYQYVNGEGQGLTGNVGGYYHWTAAIDYKNYADPVMAGTYPKTDAQYVCPSHVPGGFAPTDFTAGRIPQAPLGQTAQLSTFDDRQAPRLSYTPNEAIMPRKKFCAEHDAAHQGALSPTNVRTDALCLVKVDEIENPAQTILLAEFSNNLADVYGSSSAGALAYKTHRPTSGLKVGMPDGSGNPGHATYTDSVTYDMTGTLVGASNVFDGEIYPYFQSAPGTSTYSKTGSNIYKLTSAEAYTAIDNVTNGTGSGTANDPIHDPHMTYVNPDGHQGGSNFYFVDGHAKKLQLGTTLDPTNWMWGKRVYSCVDKPIVQDN